MFFSRRNKQSCHFQRAARSRKLPERCRPPSLEVLEGRLLLSADTWIGPNHTGGSGLWDVGSNWSLGHAPGTGDIATINTSAPATITIQSGDNIRVKSLTTGSKDTLSITGGLLTLTAGTSTLSGALSMTGGTLDAYGLGVHVTANGSTTVAGDALSGAGLYAESGATLSLPHLSSSVSNGTFQADGRGSVLDLSGLTTLTQQVGGGINAYVGGEINLSHLTSLTGTNGISLTDGGTILDGKLTSLNGVSASLDGTDKLVANYWTSFTNGNLTVWGGSYSLPGLTDVDGSNLFARGGSLTLLGVHHFTSNPADFGAYSDYFWASGHGSVLDLANLTTVNQMGNWTIHADNGGQVNLSGMTALAAANGQIILTDTTGGTILDGKVTTLSGVSATLDGTDKQVAHSWTSFTNGTLTVTGGSYNLPGLTDVDGSELFVQSGGNLTLLGVVSFTPNPADYGVYSDYFEASGTGSVLNLANLKTVNQKGNWTVKADTGGLVNVSGLTTLVAGPGQISFVETSGGTILHGA